MSRFASSVLLCSCLGFLVFGSAYGLDERTIRVDRTEAELMRVVDGWALWRTSKWLDNGGSRLSVVEFHFYRQQIPHPNADLVLHTVGGAGFNPFEAIAGDGTLIALSGKSILWYRPDGSIDESAKIGEGEILLRAYPDGVLLQVNRGTRMSHVFAPFRGKDIDSENRLEIRSWNDHLWRAEPVRSGKLVVWNTPEGLQRLDLRTGERSSIVIQNDPPQHDLRKANATALDGKLVLLGSNAVVDAVSGERVATNWDDERVNRIVLTHDRIAYRLWDGDLAAVDLGNPHREPVLIAEGVRPPIAQTEKGLLFWNGKQWSEIRWYTPDQESKAGQ